MYGHGMATIALCEAFALSGDPDLKKPAQAAVDYIVDVQHDAGGWRYSPGQMGDLSVTGWQVMALKTALMAGLDLKPVTLRKAQNFLENSVLHKASEGYGYINEVNSTYTMTAVGLLCRQFLQGWGPRNLRMIKAIDNYIKPNFPKAELRNVYYYYYATQTLRHFGGDVWKDWNSTYRELLIKTQDTDANRPEVFGSCGGPQPLDRISGDICEDRFPRRGR